MNVRNFTDLKAFLFDNLTVKQTIFKNTFWLATGTGISKFLKLSLIIYVARILGATEYGKFTFALAFISLFLIFSDLGLSNIVIREFSREKEKEKEFYSVLSLKILLSLGALFLILIGSFFITSDPAIQSLIWILALFCLVEGFLTLIYSFFQARQRMEYQAWVTILESLVVTGCGFFVILNYPSVKNLSYAYLFSSLVALIFVLFFFHFKIFSLKITWQKLIWRKFLSMSWPLALAGLFSTLYTYTDSVMMGYWKMITETGWYNAAYRIIALTFIPLGFVTASFYPMMSKFFKESKEKLQKTWNYQMETVILLAVPSVIGGIILAPRIVGFVYGQDFTPAILALQILMVMAGLVFLCTPFSYLLIASNQQRNFFKITSSAALLNIVLNLILIPKFNLYGAATATIITYLLILFLFFRFTMKFTLVQPINLKLLFTFIVAFLSSVPMYFVLLQPQIYNLNIFLSVLIGVLIYFTSLFICKNVIKPVYEKI